MSLRVFAAEAAILDGNFLPTKIVHYGSASAVFYNF